MPSPPDPDLKSLAAIVYTEAKASDQISAEMRAVAWTVRNRKDHVNTKHGKPDKKWFGDGTSFRSIIEFGDEYKGTLESRYKQFPDDPATITAPGDRKFAQRCYELATEVRDAMAADVPGQTGENPYVWFQKADKKPSPRAGDSKRIGAHYFWPFKKGDKPTAMAATKKSKAAARVEIAAGPESITPALLDSYLGKAITEICGNGYTDSDKNHCAHFVNHIVGLSVPTSCLELVHGAKPGANLRVNETFAHCGAVGVWPPPKHISRCYAFVTKRAEVDLAKKKMGEIENKHVGIYCDGRVWHYSNPDDKVVKATPDQFAKHYPGKEYGMFFGEFAGASRAWRVEIPIKVSWSDMDAYGHVNNAVYARWFEDARVAWLEQAKYPELEGKQIPVLANIQVNYRGTVKHPDTVRVRVRAREIGRSSVTLEYEVLSDAEDQLVADGETAVALVDIKKGKAIPLDARARANIIGLDAGARDRSST